ncbi:glycosyltransferase family 2 protein [Falsiroseomonas sp.]|uniref:glycosyltransferase family 2 protein n=1 Tax=Falsiroseomonas sp. TaxID=2870721 RepID=UPI0035627345
MTDMPLISIVVPTFNRAGPLARALAAIKAQTQSDFECIVIDDGSDEATIRQYAEIWQMLDDRFILRTLAVGDRKSGNPGKARNRGIAMARGTYLAFCDDDDEWVREDHLDVAVTAMREAGADLFFADIRFSNKEKITIPSWNSVVDPLLRGHPLSAGPELFAPSRTNLQKFLQHRHFHADTLVVARALLASAGPYWEHAAVAEDVEITWRLVDRARRVVYRAMPIAAVDVSPHPSAVRSYSALDRAMYFIMASLRAESVMFDPGMRRVARKCRAWGMLDLADILAGESQPRRSLEVALQALILSPSARALRAVGRGAVTAARSSRARIG